MVRTMVLAAATLLVLSGCGADVADPASVPSATTPAPLTEAALLSAEEVPARDRLTPWREDAPGSEAALACQAGSLDDLGAETVVRRRFVASIAEYPESDPSSAVDLAVLQYADPQAAEAARTQVASEIGTCTPVLDDLGEAQVVRGSHEVIAGDGSLVWQQRDFFASDVCTDCDAVRFHRMGSGVVGSRLVLVSLAEVGGPLQPAGLDPTMDALATAALGRAAG